MNDIDNIPEENKLTYCEYIGMAIKRLRKRKKITQTELSFILDICPQTIGLWEKGKHLSFENLDSIIKVLDIPIDSFFKHVNVHILGGWKVKGPPCIRENKNTLTYEYIYNEISNRVRHKNISIDRYIDSLGITNLYVLTLII